MLTIEVENKRGQILKLTGREDQFQLDNVSGLNPPTASISLSNNIGDGAEFVHSRMGVRNVVINLVINGDVEENRALLYKHIQCKEYIKLYFGTRKKKVWIEGYVEDITPNPFQNKTTCMISVLCPDPFFKAIEETIAEMNIVQPKFYFPFYTVNPIPFSVYSMITILNILNEGNAKSGMTIEILARGEVINPIVYNRETAEYIGVGSTEMPFTMNSGDLIVITTHTNNKKIKLIRNAVERNIFNSLRENSTFLQLEAGDNTFTYSADKGNENMDITFKFYSHYEGI